jgi:hypothetical protein
VTHLASEFDKGSALQSIWALRFSNGEIMAWIISNDYFASGAFKNVVPAFKKLIPIGLQDNVPLLS